MYFKWKCAHVTVHETGSTKRLLAEVGSFQWNEASFSNLLKEVMNINFRPKKCSGQSRYGRYGSYATVLATCSYW